jgi:mannitol 2-dehydrogenase
MAQSPGNFESTSQPAAHKLRAERPDHRTGMERAGTGLRSLPLNDRTVARLGARVSVPSYDRAALRRGVVHIGVGSFHRSHQAVYFDELARRGLGNGWGLTGVGLHRREMKEALDAQDGLYTVVSRGRERDEARVVGIMTRYLFVPEQTNAVLEALTDESTRLVTLTITAEGYRVEPNGAASRHGARTSEPKALALLVEALDRRRSRGRDPFTILSCDNTPGNGALARTAVLSVASRRDPGLAAWIDRRAAFPSSVVDRITPSTTDQQRRLVERKFGVRDRWPVITEPFSQWIVEDDFCNGRPPLDQVGVQFVSDVRPYALMKTRLLNAAHCAIGYLGSLAGYTRTDEAIGDPIISAYIEQMMDREIAPLLPPAGVDPATYGATVRMRFANHAIADPLWRLCRNGSTKVPAHLLSSITEARAAGRAHPLLTLAVSAWCRYLQDEAPGAPADLDDPDGERLRTLALAAGGDPLPLLSDERTFGSLGRCPEFIEAVRADLREFRESGPLALAATRLALASPAGTNSAGRTSGKLVPLRVQDHLGPAERPERSVA